MKLIKKIKQWRDRRFQKRVFKALGLDKTIQTGYIQPCDPYFEVSSYKKTGSIVTNAPTIDIDEIHNSENGHPV